VKAPVTPFSLKPLYVLVAKEKAPPTIPTAKPFFIKYQI